MATQHPFQWPGLPGGPVLFSFPVTAMIVPPWRTLQRPGIKARWPRHAVQHSNGNPDALAKQDSTYLANGAGGRQASWHGTVDHKEGFANLPADEVGWHAGDGAGPGNYNGFAVELSEYPRYRLSPAEARQARRNAAEMMGRVGARLDIDDASRQNYHRDYMIKGCPRVILENPTWLREYEADYWHFYNDELARMAGGTSTSPAAQLPAFQAGDRFKVIAANVNLRLGWGTASRIVGVMSSGQTGTVGKDPDGRFTIQADGYTWVNAQVDGLRSGWFAIGLPGDPWIEKIAKPAPPKPAPKPTYAQPSPVRELLDTNMTFEDMYNTSAGVTTINEIDFIFVADIIEFKRSSPALQYGYEESPEVKAPYQEGDRAIAAWLVKGTNGLYYYLLTGGDDEWVRVRYVDTVRISDAPLLGDDMH